MMPKDPSKHKEYLEKISRKGSKISEKTRKQISKNSKELWTNQDFHKRMCELKKGEKNPFFGKHHTQEVKELLRLKGKSRKYLHGNRNPMRNPESVAKMVAKIKGTIPSKEHRKHISETRIATGVAKREKNPAWKGGTTEILHMIRTSDKYSEWRLAVFERDDFCDCFSGVKGNGNLNAHHIIPINILLMLNNIKSYEQAMACEALWDINNGITMFKSSHVAYHNMWGNNTYPIR